MVGHVPQLDTLRDLCVAVVILGAVIYGPLILIAVEWAGTRGRR
jgi:hypothetical protein